MTTMRAFPVSVWKLRGIPKDWKEGDELKTRNPGRDMLQCGVLESDKSKNVLHGILLTRFSFGHS